MSNVPASGLQLRSLVRDDAVLELSLIDTPIPAPGDDEVIVRISAAPINPSDLGLMLGGADVRAMTTSGEGTSRVSTVAMPPAALAALRARVGASMAVGNEGGGVVVAAGSSGPAQALLGKTVGMVGGSTYAQYRVARVRDCMVMPDGVTPAQAASPFVNPMTALAIVETLKQHGGTSFVHTAAASNLGQMLVKLCTADGIGLVNVVRSPAQVALLRGLGAEHVVDSSSDTFDADLLAALTDTGATTVFDAIGGGTIVSRILASMEAAAVANAKEYSRYGSTTMKRAYIYGALDRSPTELVRSFGYSWSVSGWLLTPFLMEAGAAETQRLRDRVCSEITTTFASSYTSVISLADALDPTIMRSYARFRTGEKYLIDPTL